MPAIKGTSLHKKYRGLRGEKEFSSIWNRTRQTVLRTGEAWRLRALNQEATLVDLGTWTALHFHTNLVPGTVRSRKGVNPDSMQQYCLNYSAPEI